MFIKFKWASELILHQKLWRPEVSRVTYSKYWHTQNSTKNSKSSKNYPSKMKAKLEIITLQETIKEFFELNEKTRVMWINRNKEHW